MTESDSGRIGRLPVSFDRDTAYKTLVRALLLIFAGIGIVVLFVINFVFESRYSPDAARRAGENLGRVADAAEGVRARVKEAVPLAVTADVPGVPAAEGGLAEPEDFTGDIAESAGDDLEQFDGDIADNWDETGEMAGDEEFAFEDDGALSGGEPVLGEIPQGAVLEKDGNLLRYESEGDIFALLSTWKGLLSTAVGNELFFVTNKYDANLRLASRVEWQKNEDAPSHQTIKRTVYVYADDAAKTALSRDVYSSLDGTRERTEYDGSGLPLRVVITRGKETPETVSDTRYAYDSERRVIEKISRKFSEDGGELQETTRYAYTGKARAPDTYVYQNDALSYSVVYDADGDYTETRVLAEDYSVSTRYENYEITREVYMLNDKEVRRREY